MIRVNTLATIVEKHERACNKHDWTGYTLAEMLHAEAGEQQEIEQAIIRRQIHGPHGVIDEIHDKIAVLIRIAETLEYSDVADLAAELACTWKQETLDDHDRNCWEPSCGAGGFVLDTGNPSENGMKYCHACGRLITEKPYQPEEDHALN